jgi:hypothetical protein
MPVLHLAAHCNGIIDAKISKYDRGSYDTFHIHSSFLVYELT